MCVPAYTKLGKTLQDRGETVAVTRVDLVPCEISMRSPSHCDAHFWVVPDLYTCTQLKAAQASAQKKFPFGVGVSRQSFGSSDPVGSWLTS